MTRSCLDEHESARNEIREMCKAISSEEDSDRMVALLDELLGMLDERQLTMSLL